MPIGEERSHAIDDSRFVGIPESIDAQHRKQDRRGVEQKGRDRESRGSGSGVSEARGIGQAMSTVGASNPSPADHLSGVHRADVSARRATDDFVDEGGGHPFGFPEDSPSVSFSAPAGIIGPVNRQIAP